MAGTAVALLLAACAAAGAETPETAATTPRAAPTTIVESMNHESMDMNMGDPHATPAYDVTGAAVVSGPFEALPSVGTGGISGTAWLARHTGGTTVSIEIDGLKPRSDYVSHVHADVCSAQGGPHYRHDQAGMAHPPNEIHVAFTAGSDGVGVMTAENPTVASDLAVSVVIHEASDGTPKLACADLAP